MKHTNRQPLTKTLTDLYRAIDHQHAVTITYLKPGETEPTVRTIEAYDIRTTKNGHIEVRAMCRLRGESRRFLLDRIISYTCHRIAYVLERPEATTPAGHGIVVRSAAQLIARELGRDYLPTRPLVRSDTSLAA
ncbi:WYL domain-containing protein [Streptomyces leeuwenhoekii]|uniref:Sle1_025 protein n=1 Tax=Streptomyces leeuwenhoekii TaxID=1437453 RepID=A0A0F7VP83_STRLW|nr:WYL domain-containing protein [Streptomyces leeuwenhoekii]CQR59192.1 sle1_025 [Streptomyces leeuwenhoekii]